MHFGVANVQRCGDDRQDFRRKITELVVDAVQNRQQRVFAAA